MIISQAIKNRGPLAGLNVIDFGHYYAGPAVGMLLADQGAKVIRIVKPGGIELPTYQHRLLNRNKKLLTIDLKTENGKLQALTLVEKADVLIENFRPGVMIRLGLDYNKIKEHNPGVVYLSLPGFSAKDKKRAHLQAWEGVLGAAAGLFRDVSYVRELLGFPPVYTSVPACSMFGAIHGGIAVMAALIARETSGLGTVIETSLAEAGMTGFGWKFFIARWIRGEQITYRTNSWKENKRWLEQRENWYTQEDTHEIQDQKLFDALQVFLLSPFYQVHQCKDLRHIRLGCQSPVHITRFLSGLGIYKKLLSEGFVNVNPYELSMQTDTPETNMLDNNLSDYSRMSELRRQRLNQLISGILRTKTAAQWESHFAGHVPCTMVRTRSEWLTLEIANQSGVVAQMDDGETQLTVPGHFVDISGRCESSKALFDEAEVIDITQANILFEKLHAPVKQKNCHGPRSKGSLLKGLKVLDPSNGVAGPMAAYTLALYGAEVVKLDSTSMAGMLLGMETEQGKDNLTVDLKTRPGQQILRRLVSWADVVVHNKLDKVAERLGLGYDQLQAINPYLVTCQISAFGGTCRNGWEDRPGWDPLAQAATGLLIHYGSLEYPHSHDESMIADSMAGFGGAFAALLGVWQKCKTGYGGEARTSLARASNFFQLPYMIAKDGVCDLGEARGQFALGEHRWHRLYACKDQWLFVAAVRNQVRVLAEVVMSKSDATESDLEAAFLTKTVEQWQIKLEGADIACHPVLGVTDICNKGVRQVSNQPMEETAQGVGEVLCWTDHPCGRPIMIKAPDWVRVGENQTWKRLKPAQIPGAQTLEILQRLGYSDGEIKRLYDIEIVK